MPSPDIEAFVGGRFAELLAFYDKKSTRNKWVFYAGSIYVIVASAVLTSLTASNAECARPLATILAPSVSVIAAIITLFQSQHNWISYRSAWDALKREHSLWLARADDYAVEGADTLFVKRVESIAAVEGRGWYLRHGERAKSGGNTPESP